MVIDIRRNQREKEVDVIKWMDGWMDGRTIKYQRVGIPRV